MGILCLQRPSNGDLSNKFVFMLIAQNDSVVRLSHHLKKHTVISNQERNLFIYLAVKNQICHPKKQGLK